VALLTGARGEELADVLDQVHHLDLPDGVAYALSPVPGDRPATCRAVLEAGAELADDPTILLPALEHSGAPAPTWVDHRQHPEQFQEQLPPERRRHLWPWTLIFTLLVGVPAIAVWLEEVPAGQLLPSVLGVAALHLVLSLAARGPLSLALLCPPIVWAVILGRRVRGGRRRRAWATAVFTASMLPAIAGVVLAVMDRAGRSQALAGVAATLLLVLVCTASANAEGPSAVAVRVLLLPLWAIGAVLVIGAGMLLSPFGLAPGTVWATMTSLADGIRGPAMMRPPRPRPWR
jgi:hypothetical protein